MNTARRALDRWVGHSWGGVLIRGFAARYPDKVVGLVFLDATDCDANLEDLRAIFVRAGGTQEMLQQLVEFRRAAFAQQRTMCG